MLRAAALVLLLVPASALAQEAAPATATCPVALPVQQVRATMTTVTLDGRTFAVAGPAYRLRFHRMLRRCGLEDAAAVFASWRGLRRATNVTGVLGAVLTPFVWGGTAATATAAGVLRDDLEQTILRESREVVGGRAPVERPLAVPVG